MKHRGIGAFLLALPISAGAVCLSGSTWKASAGESPYYEGVCGGGVLLAENFGVELEREHLRFSLEEFPKDGREDEEALRGYQGSFSAEYTLYNPTAQDAELRLYVPLGTAPSYAPATGSFPSPESYRITAQGAPVEPISRFTYLERATEQSLDLETGLIRLNEERDGFYSDELPVSVYTYEVTVDGEDGKWANLSFSFEGTGKSRIFCSEHFNFVIKNGRGKLIHNFACTEGVPVSFVVYVLGDDISDAKTDVFRYEDGAVSLIDRAEVRQVSKETTTFSALAQSLRPQGEVSAADWKNALIDCIESERCYGASCVSNATASELASRKLMRWFEYNLSVPSGQRTESGVYAPIYPSIDRTLPQTEYRYFYMLSPDQRWSRFGTLTVDIDTPFYLTESSLEFEKREGGYTLTRERLPLGELTFTLSSGEETEGTAAGYTYRGDDGRTLVIAIVVLGVLFAGAVALVTVLVVQSKRRKRRRAEEEKKLLQTRPQEGKIDLPDDERDGPRG